MGLDPTNHPRAEGDGRFCPEHSPCW
jgi:hypothetical protein